MKSAIYQGRVHHRRRSPRDHSFSFKMMQLFVDLDEVDSIFENRWFWSSRRCAIARFKRSDYIGDPSETIREAVDRTVTEKIGHGISGPVRMLTHPRYWGQIMNPVTFYYCFDQDGEAVEQIVAEITNTPWGERFSYVLDFEDPLRPGSEPVLVFKKRFHVSPFMPMAQSYRWRFSHPSDDLHVHMENHDSDGLVFEADLALTRRPLNGRNLALALICFPFMTTRIAVAIYWHALRLWLKRIPFFSHPRHQLKKETA